MPGFGTKIKMVSPIIILTCCCLISTVIIIASGSKMPVLGDPDNKSVLIGGDICYVLCTLVYCLLTGLAIYGLFIRP